MWYKWARGLRGCEENILCNRIVASGCCVHAPFMPRSSPVTPDPGELPFEEALSRLEKVVDRLEQGDLELEGSLEAFEEGVKLSRRCASQLESAEQRIEVLIREGGEWLTKPFGEDASADDELDEDPDEEGDESDE